MAFHVQASPACGRMERSIQVGECSLSEPPEAYNRPLVAIDAAGAVYVAGPVIAPSSSESNLGVVKLSASTGEVVSAWRSVGSFPFLSMVADATGLYGGKLDGLQKVSTEQGELEWTAPYSSTSLVLDGRGAIYAVAMAMGETPRRLDRRPSMGALSPVRRR